MASVIVSDVNSRSMSAHVRIDRWTDSPFFTVAQTEDEVRIANPSRSQFALTLLDQPQLRVTQDHLHGD